jgi:hypothetical protein
MLKQPPWCALNTGKLECLQDPQRVCLSVGYG